MWWSPINWVWQKVLSPVAGDRVRRMIGTWLKRRHGQELSLDDHRRLVVEADIDKLSQAARFTLDRLRVSGLTPPEIAAFLASIKQQANSDAVIKELTEAGLITHDMPGLRYIRPEVRQLVDKAMTAP